jgi:hypothetical protein
MSHSNLMQYTIYGRLRYKYTFSEIAMTTMNPNKFVKDEQTYTLFYGQIFDNYGCQKLIDTQDSIYRTSFMNSLSEALQSATGKF